ncbi:MAG: nucleoside 2-deoxyribosyltransferase [Defluviitaleaceae bacterium]|nr:nucleoside 2-deoxyribosyltransferase [Defluviitaleaceae bacterium]
MSDKPIVFVITPFEEDYLALYGVMKTRFAESFEFTNAGDLDNQQNILKDIVVGIYRADVIIADLTGLNSNVFYELGLAHAMNKKVIIITQDIDELPFDIKSYRANQYSLVFHKIDELYTKLDNLLTGAISGDVQFGSPVSDFISDIPDVEKKKQLL